MVTFFGVRNFQILEVQNFRTFAIFCVLSAYLFTATHCYFEGVYIVALIRSANGIIVPYCTGKESVEGDRFKMELRPFRPLVDPPDWEVIKLQENIFPQDCVVVDNDTLFSEFVTSVSLTGNQNIIIKGYQQGSGWERIDSEGWNFDAKSFKVLVKTFPGKCVCYYQRKYLEFFRPTYKVVMVNNSEQFVPDSLNLPSVDVQSYTTIQGKYVDIPCILLTSSEPSSKLLVREVTLEDKSEWHQLTRPTANAPNGNVVPVSIAKLVKFYFAKCKWSFFSQGESIDKDSPNDLDGYVLEEGQGFKLIPNSANLFDIKQSFDNGKLMKVKKLEINRVKVAEPIWECAMDFTKPMDLARDLKNTEICYSSNIWVELAVIGTKVPFQEGQLYLTAQKVVQKEKEHLMLKKTTKDIRKAIPDKDKGFVLMRERRGNVINEWCKVEVNPAKGSSRKLNKDEEFLLAYSNSQDFVYSTWEVFFLSRWIELADFRNPINGWSTTGTELKLDPGEVQHIPLTFFETGGIVVVTQKTRNGIEDINSLQRLNCANFFSQKSGESGNSSPRNSPRISPGNIFATTKKVTLSTIFHKSKDNFTIKEYDVKIFPKGGSREDFDKHAPVKGISYEKSKIMFKIDATDQQISDLVTGELQIIIRLRISDFCNKNWQVVNVDAQIPPIFWKDDSVVCVDATATHKFLREDRKVQLFWTDGTRKFDNVLTDDEKGILDAGGQYEGVEYITPTGFEIVIKLPKKDEIFKNSTEAKYFIGFKNGSGEYHVITEWNLIKSEDITDIQNSNVVRITISYLGKYDSDPMREIKILWMYDTPKRDNKHWHVAGVEKITSEGFEMDVLVEKGNREIGIYQMEVGEMITRLAEASVAKKKTETDNKWKILHGIQIGRTKYTDPHFSITYTEKISYYLDNISNVFIAWNSIVEESSSNSGAFLVNGIYYNFRPEFIDYMEFIGKHLKLFVFTRHQTEQGRNDIKHQLESRGVTITSVISEGNASYIQQYYADLETSIFINNGPGIFGRSMELDNKYIDQHLRPYFNRRVWMSLVRFIEEGKPTEHYISEGSIFFRNLVKPKYIAARLPDEELKATVIIGFEKILYQDQDEAKDFDKDTVKAILAFVEEICGPNSGIECLYSSSKSRQLAVLDLDQIDPPSRDPNNPAKISRNKSLLDQECVYTWKNYSVVTKYNVIKGRNPEHTIVLGDDLVALSQEAINSIFLKKEKTVEETLVGLNTIKKKLKRVGRMFKDKVYGGFRFGIKKTHKMVVHTQLPKLPPATKKGTLIWDIDGVLVLEGNGDDNAVKNLVDPSQVHEEFGYCGGMPKTWVMKPGIIAELEKICGEGDEKLWKCVLHTNGYVESAAKMQTFYPHIFEHTTYGMDESIDANKDVFNRGRGNDRTFLVENNPKVGTRSEYTFFMPSFTYDGKTNPITHPTDPEFVKQFFANLVILGEKIKNDDLESFHINDNYEFVNQPRPIYINVFAMCVIPVIPTT